MSGRKSIRFLEDLGMELMSKKDSHVDMKKPPRLREKNFNYIEFLSDSGLQTLTPNSCVTFPSRMYDPAKEKSYVEQCFTSIRRIAEGSYGYVMTLNSKDDGMMYALKMAKHPYRGEKDRQLKVKEVENLLKVSNHRNIVSLHTAWEEDGVLYMLLEPCQSNLKQLPHMTEQDCWAFLVDIVSALEYVHKNGIGHFDVKPDNILLGFDGWFKLCDFGLARSFKSSQHARLSYEGDGRYLAPEIFGVPNGTGFTEKADIFSLGISVLELAARVVLPSHGEVWKALRCDTFPRKQTENMSEGLLKIVVQMMVSDPSHRPTAAELVNFPEVITAIQMRVPFIGLNSSTPVRHAEPKLYTSTPLSTICDADTGYESVGCDLFSLVSQISPTPSTSGDCTPNVRTLPLTPDSCTLLDDSPLNLTRDLKQAIKRMREYEKMRPFLPRRRLFMDDGDADQNNSDRVNNNTHDSGATQKRQVAQNEHGIIEKQNRAPLKMRRLLKNVTQVIILRLIAHHCPTGDPYRRCNIIRL